MSENDFHCPECKVGVYWLLQDGAVLMFDSGEGIYLDECEGTKVIEAHQVTILTVHECLGVVAEPAADEPDPATFEDERLAFWSSMKAFARGFECPGCGAKEGQDCVHKTRGTEINWPHAERFTKRLSVEERQSAYARGYLGAFVRTDQ